MESATYLSSQFKYTKEEKASISLYFPKKHQKNALLEVSKHVSALISCIGSPSVPQNVNRKKDVSIITKLQSSLKDAEKQLAEISQRNSTIKARINKHFLRIAQKKYRSSSLQTADEHLKTVDFIQRNFCITN